MGKIIYNHFFISGILTFILYIIFYKIKESQRLYTLITILLVFNFSIFNIYLLSTGTFNYKIHLPLHLCYLTELGILISIIFKTQYLYSWLILNSLGGGITGFTNSNLPEESMFIEYVHLYLSHFNLLLFTIIAYRIKFTISKVSFLKSTLFNLVIFITIFCFNLFVGSNYWFTNRKPMGLNLTLIFPDWPYYLLGLIMIGLISYYLTFRLFSRFK